ncbi:hypothetical protein QE320_gp009 [Pseudomonas phage EM]|uniref:Uncharacterized protein n=1 Tax=Pseudomonas phage EM TaxID=2936914 RepID=A0AAE9KU47_9CAUD|nr:hypothetical protein QE320_gp009 [Pseudomonas phage EM]UPW35811.1 hypothetical protein EM_009 [Pseudomonas phage EM]
MVVYDPRNCHETGRYFKDGRMDLFKVVQSSLEQGGAMKKTVVYFVRTPTSEDSMAVQRWLAGAGIKFIASKVGSYLDCEALSWEVTLPEAGTPHPFAIEEDVPNLCYVADLEYTIKNVWERAGYIMREVLVDIKTERKVSNYKIKRVVARSIPIKGGDYTLADLQRMIEELQE